MRDHNMKHNRTLRAAGLVLVALIGAALLIPRVAETLFAETIDENTPVPAVGAPGGPSRELTPTELETWKRGRLLFDKDFRLEDGLGTPELNGDSCRGCHQDPVIGGAGGLDVNVFRFGFDDNGQGPFQDLPGGQAASKLRRQDAPGRENHDVQADVFEQRQTPTAFGIGQVETIADATILANEDPLDLNQDGIIGVARMVNVGGVMEVGKFGWKGQVPRVIDFAHDASTGELGLTMPDNGRGFGAITDNDSVADPEISDAELNDLTFYLEHLAAPARKGGTDAAIATGEALFTDIGCATCHIPSLEGSEGPVVLYSNLLLHNVMATDFRGMSEPGAGVGMYRTPPLWGISDTAPFMHDGRSTTLEAAILDHAGEAAQVTANYQALSSSEQEALIKFLEDL